MIQTNINVNRMKTTYRVHNCTPWECIRAISDCTGQNRKK